MKKIFKTAAFATLFAIAAANAFSADAKNTVPVGASSDSFETGYQKGLSVGLGDRCERGHSSEYVNGFTAAQADRKAGNLTAFSVRGAFIQNSALVFCTGGEINGTGTEYGEKGLIDGGANIAPFYIGKYEVTQEFYEAVMKNQFVSDDKNKYKLDTAPSYNAKSTLVSGETQERRPVDSVTWFDAVYFCNALSKLQGLQIVYKIEIKKVEGNHITDATVSIDKNANGFRLPSEEEWELACRGGDPAKKDFAYSFSGASSPSYNGKADTSADLDKVGWYAYNPSGKTSSKKGSKGVSGFCTHEVGKKGANALGIFDMSGNVYEWVYDIGDDNERIIRGGAYTTEATACKVTAWNDEKPGIRMSGIGFRIARNAK